ncbi:MAG: hypothetical protein Q4G69_11935 [Planctomycetia bacterium]|nr:hypothetical protein [Planctomycetia bacterium]
MNSKMFYFIDWRAEVGNSGSRKEIGQICFWKRGLRGTMLPFMILVILFSIKSEGTESAGSILKNSAASQALSALDWMLGSWKFSLESGTLLSRIERSKSENYLLREDRFFDRQSVLIHEEKTIIAWNPVSELFETWTFRSDGSFGGGIFEQFGNQWSAPVKMILFDGQSSTANNIYTPQETGGFIWESISRTLDDLALPDIPPTAAEEDGSASKTPDWEGNAFSARSFIVP